MPLRRSHEVSLKVIGSSTTLLEFGVNESLHHVKGVTIWLEGDGVARNELSLQEAIVVHPNDNCRLGVTVLVLDSYCGIARKKTPKYRLSSTKNIQLITGSMASSL